MAECKQQQQRLVVLFYELWFMVAGALSESGIKHGSVVDAVVVVTEVCERFTFFVYYL